MTRGFDGKEWAASWKGLHDDCEARIAELEAARADDAERYVARVAQVARLEAALRRYGVHERGYAMLDHPFDHKDCTCGLRAALGGS
jgi:hypothetical protein